MVTLEKLDNLGYVVAIKGKDKYIINDCLGIHRTDIWGEDLNDVIVYPTIQAARKIARNFDEDKEHYSTTKDIVVEVRIIHKKEVMVARLKGTKDE